MTDIVTQKDTPTHRLTVKLEDGTFRTFRLTKTEAAWLADNINSNDPFIVLPQTIDPRAPSFYPKRGATLEAMTDQEIQDARRRYAPPSGGAGELAVDREARMEREAATAAWVASHDIEFKRMEDSAQKYLSVTSPFYKAASRGVRKTLAHHHARKWIADDLAAGIDPSLASREVPRMTGE